MLIAIWKSHVRQCFGRFFLKISALRIKISYNENSVDHFVPKKMFALFARDILQTLRAVLITIIQN